MPISRNLPSTAEALPQLLTDDSWLSPVSSIAQRLSDASFQTPKAKQAAPVGSEAACCAQPLASDSVKFNFDDSSDSFHQFMTNQASDSPSCDASFDSDWDALSAALEPNSPCRPRALAFGSSPSAPLLDCGRGEQQQQQQQQHQQQQHQHQSRRLLSMPLTASSPSCERRRRQKATKRPKPHDAAGSGCGRAASPAPSAGCRSLTPKRRRLGDITNSQQQQQQKQQKPLARCMSELSALADAACGRLDHAKVDKAIASIDSLNLIGNSSCTHSLPTVRELNYGIRYVTCDTVRRLVNGEFKDTVPAYRIIDCRYPYEYEGGHIKGAVNIFRHDDLLESVLQPASRRDDSKCHQKPVLIFHCEFSSERAPKLARFLRQRDRELNSPNYPDLYFPEVYVLQGGYKLFYETHRAACAPVRYTKMSDPQHKEALSHFQKLGKAWERQNSRSRHSKLEMRARLL